MLLQTNSYIVPKEKRAAHARLMRRFRQALGRLGCEHFEVYEQAGVNWGPVRGAERVVQILRFRDRQHFHQVQEAERLDAPSQELIREFCELIDFGYQQEQGLFAVGYYSGVMEGEEARMEEAGGAPGIGHGESRDFTTADADRGEQERAAAGLRGKMEGEKMPAGGEEGPED